MENVPEVIGRRNIKNFQKWEQKLASLGYSNFIQILNGKNYGIPQGRRRCFMVSILGEYTYSFPIHIKRKYSLKDLLEKTVDEKYYLTKDHIQRITNWKAQQKPLEIMKKNKTISPTLTARGAGEEHSGMVLIDTDLFKDGEVVDFDSSNEFRRNHSNEESPTIVTHSKYGVVEKDNGGGIPIMEATKKGYKIAHEGDGVDISGRMEYHRGTVQKGLAQTIKTKPDVGVVVEEDKPKIIGSYQPNSFCAGQVVDPNGIAPTFLENHGSVMGVIEDESMFTDTEKKLFTEDGNIRRYLNSDKVDEFKEGEMATTTFPNGYGHGPQVHKESIALNTIDKPVVKQNLRIRKLTPKDCIRLMGFADEDYEAMRSIGMGDSAIEHMAGDSIIVTVLIAIFSQLFDDNKHKEIINDYVEKNVIENKK